MKLTDIKSLAGSGDKIMLFSLPFIAGAFLINYFLPGLFAVGPLSTPVNVFLSFIFFAGVVLWLWSIVLILTISAKNKLITNGPYKLVKHPLYTSVSLLVVPTLGILLGSWIGVLIGLTIYIASRKYAPLEEKQLSKKFGDKWSRYVKNIKFPQV